MRYLLEVFAILFLLSPLSFAYAVTSQSANSSPQPIFNGGLDGAFQATSTTSSGSLPNYVPRSNPPGALYKVGGGPLSFEVATLQGLAARTKPQIYVGNQFWLDYTTKLYGLKYQSISQNSAMLMFKNLVTDSNGKIDIILYDAKDTISPAQLNMARTLAGVYNALPVSSSELSSVQSLYGSSNIKTIYNLQGMFSDKISAYDWLWKQVGSKVTRAFVSTSPNGDLGMTDYAVQHSSFVFEFGLSKVMTSAETTEAKKILSNYPTGTSVLGFFGFGPETQSISFLSGLGLFMISCDGVENLSLYSGLPEATNLKQAAPPSSVTYDPTKTYIAIQFSQGNSLGHLFGMNYNLWIQTDSQGKPIRSEIPESWQINPVAAELAPPIMNYYYQTMYPDDYFLSSSSGGAGYVHPDQLPNLGAYLNLANQFNNNADLNDYVIVTGNSRQMQPSLYQTFATDTTVHVIFTKMPHNQQPMEVSGVPVFTMTFKVQQSSWTTSDITNAVNSLNNLATKNKFIWIFMANNNPGQAYLLALVKALGSKFVPLRSDQFASVYKQYVAAG